MSSHIRDYIELALPWSSLRLCRSLEKEFSDLRGCQLELMKYLCSDVCKSEYYLDCHRDAWRRTTISLNCENNPHHIFSAESTECKEIMAKIMKRSSNERDIECIQLMKGKVEIRSNILPGRAYLERIRKLEPLELELKSLLTRVHNMLMGTSCSIGKRGFFPKSILDEACNNGNVSLMEKVNEWRDLNGGRCRLAKDLEATKDIYQDNREFRTSLQKIPPADVEEVVKLGQGSEGSVYQVSWCNKTYAKKSFVGSGFQTERDVALRILHPHVATAFGYSDSKEDADGHSIERCLFMEMMTESLYRLIIERDASSIKPPLSCVESLDVLLQIGMGMDCMHANNVVHGDLKSLNILVSTFEVSENERYLLTKVADFDCAKFVKFRGQDLKLGGPLGTLNYSAPEDLSLLRGLEVERKFVCTEKMDVYSFGALAFEVLTGHKPVNWTKDDRLRVIRGQLTLRDTKEWKNLIKEYRYPDELIKLVEKCWELDPEERPEFSTILPIIKECMSTVERWEKQAAHIWKYYVPNAVCLIIAVICYFILLR
ncbi:hypothetical protein M758_11G064300 [Ceratodon purpureus]|nr:hypothetical protein M758_11G064300 [Ceratodon purpureus]